VAEVNTTFVVIFLCAGLGDNYLAFVATHYVLDDASGQ